MRIGADRVTVLIRTQPLGSLKVQLRAGGIHQIIILNILPSAGIISICIFYGNEPPPGGSITFRMNFKAFACL